MKTEKLTYSKTRFFVENKTRYKIIAKISLNDDCKNGMYDFSITASIYKKKGNGQFYQISVGCLHEEIKKHLKSVNNYGYLNCGRHLKNEINAKSLKLFYDEFITYGISSVSDATTIKSIELYLKSVK